MNHIKLFESFTTKEILETISDVFLISFEDKVKIQEVDRVKYMTPTESIMSYIRKESTSNTINIKGIWVCVDSYDPATELSQICFIYNRREISEYLIETLLSRFYKRLSKFGLCRVGSRLTIPYERRGNMDLVSIGINIGIIKPKEKKS